VNPLYDVPCNGCTLCCQGDAIRLLPQDDPALYQTVPHFVMAGEVMLAHKANGDCIYLDGGCTIQATKPLMCKEMDCRRVTQAVTWTQARKLDAKGQLKMIIWRKGKDLMRPNTPRP
jgi:Fe-S-cluster containining protein